MKFRRYCVVVSDNWTPTQYFWTKFGACQYAADWFTVYDAPHVKIYQWYSKNWNRII